MPLVLLSHTHGQLCRPAVKFLAVWLGQALWVWVTLLPVLILNGSRIDNNFQWSDAVGGVLWVVGFACEALADFQKSSFKTKPENKGKFIDTGEDRELTSCLQIGPKPGECSRSSAG